MFETTNQRWTWWLPIDFPRFHMRISSRISTRRPPGSWSNSIFSGFLATVTPSEVGSWQWDNHVHVDLHTQLMPQRCTPERVGGDGHAYISYLCLYILMKPCHMMSHDVTWCHMMSHDVTWWYMMLHGIRDQFDFCVMTVWTMKRKKILTKTGRQYSRY